MWAQLVADVLMMSGLVSYARENNLNIPQCNHHGREKLANIGRDEEML